MAEKGDKNIIENKYALSYYEEISLRLELFKTTFKAKSFTDENEYAIRKTAISERAIGYCTKELESLRKLDQKFIVPYDEWWVEENYYVKQNYQDVNTNFNYGSLFLPHFSHLLHSKMRLYSLTLTNINDELKSNYIDKNSNSLTPCGYFVASQLFTEIVAAVNYLHQLSPPVYHRNLKLENIMLTIDGSTPDNFVRLSDIGLTALESDHYHAFAHNHAPEVNNLRQFSAKSDAYSLGVIANQLFIINFNGYHDDMLRVKYSHLTDLVNRLTSLFAENRQSCAQILSAINSWSLCYDEVREDSTVKAIVSKTRQIRSNEDAFIEHFIRSKSKQKLTAEPIANEFREKSHSDASLSPAVHNACVVPRPPVVCSNKKPIFISYARKDASPHARSLKTWLNNYGCDAYLDVDEIKPGVNWQDDLNDAVNNCVIFVALVTPWYGSTRWTKKEIQLADTIDKPIIPVSFIDNWPPVQLALNLGATNFIPWKTDEEINATSGDAVDGGRYDIRHWEGKCVDRTAKEIAEKLRRINQMRQLSPLVSPNNTFTASLSSKSNGEYRIIISCHPNQHQFVTQLREQLKKLRYSIWVSTDEQYLNNNSAESDEHVSHESISQSLDDLSKSEPKSNELSLSNTILFKLNSIKYRTSLSRGNNTNDVKFCDKVNTASVVILVLSEDYCQSQTSKQQAFYCDQRVPVIAIKYDSFQAPNELTKLFEEQNGLERDDNNDCFVANLKEKIDKLASITRNRYNFNKFNGFEDQMYSLAQQFRAEQSLLFAENTILIYIVSSGQTLSTRAQAILKAVGRQLASILMIKLITGDNDCEQELLVNSFIEEDLNDANVYHILPEGMNAMKGQTLNVGQSVKERDAVVSQLINFCLLIDNGDEAIRVAENFSWNDMFVIPVVDEEIDENKHSLLPQLLKDVPIGVNTEDWKTLLESREKPEDISIAVKNIILCLNKTLFNSIDNEFLL